MELFQFQLKPIEECAFPGENTKNFSWFYLTDSWYSIQLGETQLFCASPQWLENWPDIRTALEKTGLLKT